MRPRSVHIRRARKHGALPSHEVNFYRVSARLDLGNLGEQHVMPDQRVGYLRDGPARPVARTHEESTSLGRDRLETVLETFPGSRRTAFKFRDGAFCGCNLFLFKSRAARRAALTWRTVETERKRPLAIVRRFGLGTLLGYVLRRFTLQGAFTRFSKRIGIRAAPVILPYAMAAVDVDREADVELVTSALENTPRFPG